MGGLLELSAMNRETALCQKGQCAMRINRKMSLSAKYFTIYAYLTVHFQKRSLPEVLEMGAVLDCWNVHLLATWDLVGLDCYMPPPNSFYRLGLSIAKFHMPRWHSLDCGRGSHRAHGDNWPSVFYLYSVNNSRRIKFTAKIDPHCTSIVNSSMIRQNFTLQAS